MRISHNWLKRYIDIKLKPGQLAEGLSMLGLEVEHYEEQEKMYEGFLVGEVLECQRHPNADRLTVCRVNTGKEQLQIVCGAPNVAAGQKVAVGLVGATVPKNQHDPSGQPFVLQKIKIRGVESSGMICSEYELDLGEDKDGIKVLESSATVGISLAQYLRKTDIVYDLEITANRGDWLSHIGVAREIAAMTGKPLKAFAGNPKESKEQVGKHASVQIRDAEKCPRYVARVLRNVTVRPSPAWLQDLLIAVGVRPINNIVDITNFVMLETGQPLHAFDYDMLEGHRIVVKCAKEAERFVTLDGKERILDSDTLMICDGDRSVAIAGVMGGMNSEISEKTRNVLLESAFFNPANIRWTSRRLGLSTEASQRFERSVDIEMTLTAANRAAQLFQELAGAEVLKGSIDVYPKKRKPRIVGLRVARTNAVLGTDLTAVKVASFLKRLGIAVKKTKNSLVSASIPAYRNDLQEEIDLIEEVARIFGYNNIEIRTDARVNLVSKPEQADIEDIMREILVGAGFNEMVTNSLQNRAHALLSGEPPVEVLNPVSVDMQMLRPSLIPGALDVVQRNFNHGQSSIRMFEFGKVYRRIGTGRSDSLEGYSEGRRLLLVLAGTYQPQHYSSSSRAYDFFDMKGEVESLLSKFFLDKYRLIYYDNGKPLSAGNIDVEIQGTYTGFLGTLKKQIAATFDIDREVYLCELNVDVLQNGWDKRTKFAQLPKFPSVTRDLAFVVNADLLQADLEKVIREAGGTLLKSLTLFDVYVGEPLGAGKKSLAYALELQPSDHTLNDQEANAVITRIVDLAKNRCGAALRS